MVLSNIVGDENEILTGQGEMNFTSGSVTHKIHRSGYGEMRRPPVAVLMVIDFFNGT